MYFQINKTGCQEHKGLCEVRYDLFLDPEDHNYNEHYVQVPVIPEGGYTGKKDEMGRPLDQAAYDAWYAGLERVWQNNPFCCHFCQFEPEVTDEEILFVGELALDMAHKNWKLGNLALNKNQPAALLTRADYDVAKSVVNAEKESIKAAEAKRMSLAPIGSIELPPRVENHINKIKACEARMETFHATDFVAFEKTIETNYSIRA